MYKTYSLTFDAFGMANVLPQLYAFVQANAFTYQFYAPFNGCILIKSMADLLVLTGSYNAFFAGTHFLISEVDPGKTGGRLAQEVWDWLNNPEPPLIPYTPLGPA